MMSSTHRLFAEPPNLEMQDRKLTLDDWNWKLMDEQGKTHVLSEYKGQIIFVNFWATWCPNCIAEFPDIEQIYQQYGDKIVFLLVSNEDAEKLEKFKHKKSYTFPIYRSLSALPSLMEHRVIPTTFIIDQSGEIRSHETGTVDWNAEVVHRFFDELLD